MFVATQMYLPEPSNNIFWMIKFLLVSFNETFLFISWFFSHLHDIRASGFAVTLQYNLTVCCSLTVRFLGETRTFGGLNDKPGAPGGPCKPGDPRRPGFPVFLAGLVPQDFQLAPGALSIPAVQIFR